MNGIDLPCAWPCASKTSSPFGAAALGELVVEPALADPRFGDDPDRGRLAALGARQRLLERAQLRGAADELREAALAGEVEARARLADPSELEDLHRPARALDLELAEVLEVEVAAGQLGGALGQVGLARLGQRLHPLRQADGVADRRVGGAAAPVDRAGDDLAGVDPDPGREVEPLRPPQLGGVLGDVVEHLQRRVAGAPGVVLVGDRGAEDRHDPVAGELVDRALEAGDGLGQQREEALHDLAPLLGILLLGQVHRAADVGEQDRDLLTLGVVLDGVVHESQRLRLASLRYVRSVLVTGASTGIGRATALRLDGSGWRVFAGVRKEADAESLRQEASPNLVPVILDVTDPEQIAAAAVRIERESDGGGSTASSTTPASPSPARWRRSRSRTSATSSRSTSSPTWR